MEKIFDIAKDSEKSWGVIAQGIDGNFEEVEKEIDEISAIDQKILLILTICTEIMVYIIRAQQV